MSAVVLEDFCRPFFRRELSKREANLLMKLTVLVFGAICVGLVFVVEKLGAVLQVSVFFKHFFFVKLFFFKLSMSIGAIASGPSLGIFTMGMLIPQINSSVSQPL